MKAKIELSKTQNDSRDDNDFVEIEVHTPNVDDTEKRETTPEGDTNQINTGSGTHNKIFKEEDFETRKGGSISGSMTSNNNNKSKSTKIPVPKIAAQQKRDSLSETAKKSEGEEFPNRTTGSSSHNVCKRRYKKCAGNNKTTEIERLFFVKDFLFGIKIQQKNLLIMYLIE